MGAGDSVEEDPVGTGVRISGEDGAGVRRFGDGAAVFEFVVVGDGVVASPEVGADVSGTSV